MTKTTKQKISWICIAIAGVLFITLILHYFVFPLGLTRLHDDTLYDGNYLENQFPEFQEGDFFKANDGQAYSINTKNGEIYKDGSVILELPQPHSFDLQKKYPIIYHVPEISRSYCGTFVYEGYLYYYTTATIGKWIIPGFGAAYYEKRNYYRLDLTTFENMEITRDDHELAVQLLVFTSLNALNNGE